MVLSSAEPIDQPAVGEPVPLSAGRDLRIDFIRGLALLMIFIDHNRCLVPNQHHWLSDYTLGRYSFIDAADVFVLLSGCVSGMVYSRILRSQSLTACVKKALRRCVQLHISQVSLLLICFTLVHSAHHSYLAGTWAGAP